MHANGAFDSDFRYITIPNDAQAFLNWVTSWANIYIWSSALFTRVGGRIRKAFPYVSDYFCGWAGQELCEVGAYVFPGGKPVFFKTLEKFLSKVDRYRDGNILLIDDSSYKMSYNPAGTYIILPPIAKRPGDYLTKELKQWLSNWYMADDHRAFACTFDKPTLTKEDEFVAKAVALGKKTISYGNYLTATNLSPVF